MIRFVLLLIAVIVSGLYLISRDRKFEFEIEMKLEPKDEDDDEDEEEVAETKPPDEMKEPAPD